MPETQATAVPAAKKKRERSPDYPALDLATALERAVVLYDKHGMHWGAMALVFKHWGYSKGSSSGLLDAAALMKYGLLEDKGAGGNREFKLTDAFRLYHLDKRP